MENVRVSHYELRRLLGRGAMGEVHEAFDLKAKRAVALKFVAPELAADPESFRRFESEALNAAALNHPHIATLFEFEPEGQRPFIAMELVPGPNLRYRMDGGRLPIHDALVITRDVAAALAYAHRRNIVHRDIKPENLMFDEEGRIKVMDFGLARALLASRLTVTGTSLGTPSYMSPESVALGSGGPPSDVFALGLVMVEMITGRQVFRGETPLSVMFAIANVEPPALRTLDPEVPGAVETLAARMLEKDPEKRIEAATAARELAEMTGVRFSQLAIGRGEPVPRPATAVVTSGAVTQPILQTTGSDGRRTQSLKPAILLFLALGLMVVAGLAMLRAQSDRRARRDQAILLNNQAHTAIQGQDWAGAKRLLHEALSRDPHYSRALFNLAFVHDQQGSVDSAAALYGAIVKSNARDSGLVGDALYNLGDIDLRTGAPGQAVDHLTHAFAYDSSQLGRYNNLGLALVLAQRPADAILLLERGIARFPSAAPLYKNAGFAWFTMGRDSAALAQLDLSLQRDPRLGSARALRARVRARLGDKKGALADWRLFLVTPPLPTESERTEVARELAEHGIASQ